MSALNVESSAALNEVLKTTNQNSQRIIANMKEVINSNKKKSRNHYRRKKENEINFEPEITDISNVMNNSLTIVSPNVSLDEINGSLTKTSTNGVDRKKSMVTHNDEMKVKSPLKTVSIRHHFSPKPKKGHEKTLNAFEVMMTARNKVIGLNTPGKDSVPAVGEENMDDTKASNAKRKLLLEDWAERKGGFKRKLQDEAREEYILHQLNKRSKRFKDMLENGNSSTAETAPKKRSHPPKSSSKLSLKVEKSEKVFAETKTIKRKRVQVPESSSSDEDSSAPLNSEDAKFVEQLSSPLKKRDSLLGYFSKVHSSSSTQTIVDISLESEIVSKGKNVVNAKSNKKNEKRKHAKTDEENSVNLQESKPNAIEETKPSTIGETNRSGRPRRSCTLNPRYDYDLYEREDGEKSNPCKQNRKNSRKKIDSTKPVKNDSESIVKIIEIVDLETSVEEYFQECTKTVSTKKLAPIFVKSTPKPIADPELVKARQAFLMSGVPEKLKIELEKQKQFQQMFETSAVYFPKMSHIYQEGPEVSNTDAIDWGKCKIKWRTESPAKFQTPEKRTNDVLRVDSEVIKLTPLKSLALLKNKKPYVEKLKTQYEDFHTNRCFNQLKKKYSNAKEYINLDTHQISDSLVMTRRRVRKKVQDTEINLPSSVNGDLLFTEKYKPMSFEEVVVNKTPFNELREFLLSWQVEKSIMKQQSSSMSSCSLDMEYSNNSPNNFSSVVLCGPSSSGKTNAVFALANELNFNVLEINAGMKRTGKKLLQELHEATQSHQLDRDRNKALFKQLLNGNRKESSDDDSSSLDSPNEKRSLVLVEDADIVFEQDAGFIEAIHQLVASSKRPVILTANNVKCSHLTRLINQRVIDFSLPDALSISKFLSILSLVENCPIDLDNIAALYFHNQCNLRKTLLEMQFFIQSGGDRVQSKSTSIENNFSVNFSKRLSPGKAMKTNSSVYVHRTLFDFFTKTQNISRAVPFPVDLQNLHNSLESIFKKSKAVQDDCKDGKRHSAGKKSAKEFKCDDKIKGLHRLVDFYEQISTVEYMIEQQGLHEPSSLSDEINHYLVEGTLKTHLQTEQFPYNLSSKDLERSPISQAMSMNSLRSNRSVALDYEPCLRSICRNEKSRLLDDRRGSRFYHYLRNICAKSTSFSMKFFDQYCSILQDPCDADQSPNDTNKESV